jgi:CheY-like chemotaxis protein
LIVDIRIPGNGGLEFIEWLRALPGYDDVPVIVSSGMEFEADIKKACSLGVLAYIVKPMTPEKWWPVIKELKKLHVGLMVEAA